MIHGLLLAAAVLSGPVPAEVVQLTDGDTIEVQATLWPDLTLRVDVRLRGIDTPEKAWRARCDQERELAAAASLFTAQTVPVGTKVQLLDIGPDKYGGRIVARVLVGGLDLGQALIRAGYARPYDGGTKAPWCPTP